MRLTKLLSCLAFVALLASGCTSPETTDDDGEGGDGGDGGDGGNGDAATGSSTSMTGDDGTMMVHLADNEFQDGDKTIAAGDTLTYMNVGQNPHTVTIHYAGNNGQGGDPATTTKIDQRLEPGEDVDYTFAAAGTYHVWCKLHGSMTSGMASVVTVQ